MNKIQIKSREAQHVMRKQATYIYDITYHLGLK